MWNALYTTSNLCSSQHQIVHSYLRERFNIIVMQITQPKRLRKLTPF